MKKKPDLVVFSEEDGYNASLLPYGTNVSAPAITLEDTKSWKVRGVLTVNHQLKTKFTELKDEYIRLIEAYNWNQLVYSSDFNWEPVFGETYYLYEGKEKPFLSLISPVHWKKHPAFIGSFKLRSDRVWEKIDE